MTLVVFVPASTLLFHYTLIMEKFGVYGICSGRQCCRHGVRFQKLRGAEIPAIYGSQVLLADDLSDERIGEQKMRFEDTIFSESILIDGSFALIYNHIYTF